MNVERILVPLECKWIFSASNSSVFLYIHCRTCSSETLKFCLRRKYSNPYSSHVTPTVVWHVIVILINTEREFPTNYTNRIVKLSFHLHTRSISFIATRKHILLLHKLVSLLVVPNSISRFPNKFPSHTIAKNSSQQLGSWVGLFALIFFRVRHFYSLECSGRVSV